MATNGVRESGAIPEPLLAVTAETERQGTSRFFDADSTPRRLILWP